MLRSRVTTLNYIHSGGGNCELLYVQGWRLKLLYVLRETTLNHVKFERDDSELMLRSKIINYGKYRKHLWLNVGYNLT
jgi:hypothetical protein